MKRKASMPSAELLEAHMRSSHHRSDVASSDVCGCFRCLALFRPVEVVGWCDEGLTALCPRCGVDAVLPSASGSLRPELLQGMQAYWFGPA